LYGAAICIAWWAKGRDLLPLSSMMQLLPFVLAKLRIYGRKDKGWVRTDRTSE
jgi:hypothetical protein